MANLSIRLRASAQAMRTLDGVSLRPSGLALIDRVQADHIARELEEAAQALEAQREDRREVLRILYEAHRKASPSPSLAAISSAIQHLQAVEDASAQVEQEGGGVATDGDFMPEEQRKGRAMRNGVLVYCCYGMYCEAGHSSDCKYAAGVEGSRNG